MPNEFQPSDFIQITEAGPGRAPCPGCSGADKLVFGFDFAFQPIVDLASGEVWAHEALVRGPDGQGAAWVLDQVNEHNRYRFDQACRIKAIKTAAALGMRSKLSINFLPNAVYKPEVCIRTTLEAARTHDFPLDRIMFEVTEGERVNDGAWLAGILREYQRCGFLTAIDDFGSGFAGLTLLADFQPDLIKLDMSLVRHIDTSRPRQAIARGLLRTCAELGIGVIAEGIETPGERDFFLHEGVTLMQGWLFARAAFRSLTEPQRAWGDAVQP